GQRDRLAVRGSSQISAGDRDSRRLLEAELRTEHRRLERSGTRWITHQRIRQPVRDTVHRARNGDAAILMSPTTIVLDGGEEAGVEDGYRRSRRMRGGDS